MAKRSLKASPTGIAIAKRAFQRTGWTQEYLASEVGLETRQSIWKFFSGRPVERYIFVDICFRLDLEWEEIAEPPEVDPLPTEHLLNKQSETLLQQLRANHHGQIVASCDPLQFPIPQPQPRLLTQTYVVAEAFSDLVYQRWLSVEELSIQDSGKTLLPADLERTSAKAIAAKNTHVAVTGRLGIGKTTFLKHLALECAAGRFRPDCVPVFLPLQQIQQRLVQCKKISELILEYLALSEDSLPRLEALLSQGRIFLLLDGVDEISNTVKKALFDHVRESCRAFPKSPIILSHRAAGHYPCLPGFK